MKIHRFLFEKKNLELLKITLIKLIPQKQQVTQQSFISCDSIDKNYDENLYGIYFHFCFSFYFSFYFEAIKNYFLLLSIETIFVEKSVVPDRHVEYQESGRRVCLVPYNV